MKNTEQLAKIQAVSLLSAPLSPELLKEIEEILKKEGSENFNIFTARKELADKLDPKVKEELQVFGVELPTDAVELKVSVGTFLFDVLVAAEKPAQAPLKRMAQKKFLMEVAEGLNKEEISLPPEAVEKMKELLNSEKDWENMLFTAVLTKVDKAMQLKSVAMVMFPEVLEKSMEYLLSL